MAAPESDSYVDFKFWHVHHAPPELPAMAVFTITSQKKYCRYVVDADGSTCYVDGIVTTWVMEPKCFNVPFDILFEPLFWARRASAIGASSDEYYFRVGTVAHARLLRSLCDLVPAKADEAYSHECNKLDVAINVQTLIPHVVRYVVPPPLAPAPEELVNTVEMKLELRKIGEGESCAICFEGFKESKKEVQTATETPCSHLFQSDCLHPWLMKATTCPLCRSTLY